MHKFHSFGQDQATVAQQAEMTVAKCSLISCMRVCSSKAWSQFYRHARNLCPANALISSRRPQLGARYGDGKSVFDEPASRWKAHACNCASRSWLFLSFEGQTQQLSNQKLPLHTTSSAALSRSD